MHLSRLITRLFARTRVEWFVALVMLALAYFDLTARSLTVIRFEAYGLDPWMQATLLALGAVFAAHSRGRDWQFYLATVPLLMHVGMSLVVVLEYGGGYHQGVLYVLALGLLYLTYARQEDGCDE